MAVRAEKLNAKRLRRALLAVGTAGMAICYADPALAGCVIAPGGTGTVANPGPNSTVVCTGTTNGILVAGTNSDTTVHVEGGAEINGVTGDEISLNGNAAHIFLGGGTTPGPAIVRDVSISAFGSSAQIDIVDGSVIDQSGNAAALVMVDGNGAGIGIGAGSQVTVSRAVQVHGSGAALVLEAGATLAASSGFVASSLIFGGMGAQLFYIDGEIEARGANSVETLIDATDGDDQIYLNSTTRFTTGSSATLTPTFLLDGGNDFDKLYLSSIDQSLQFDTRRIELLTVDPGASFGVSRIYGTHEFQEILVRNGQLDVFGAAAFGATGSIVEIQGNSRIRFFDTGSGVLSQRFVGGGAFEYHGGTHEFASANFLTGDFLLVGGVPVISHNNAFGTASVTNFADVVLRDVNIANELGGNGNYIIDGVSTYLGGINSMSGTIDIRSGRLVIGDVASLGNGQVLTPAEIIINPTAELVLDMSGNGTLGNELSGSGTLGKYLVGNLTINRANPNFSGQVNLLGGRTFVNADGALGTGVVFINAALNPGDVTIANALSGSGPIEKNGTGITQLLGNNSSYSGLLVGNAGTIRVTNGSGLGSANVLLSQAGALQVDIASGSTVVANILQGSGVFRKSGVGQVDLTGPNTLSGGTIIDAGTLRVSGPAAIGTGAISVASGATFLFDNAANATFANAVSGAGTFRKMGAGQLSFSNPFSVGALAVDAGRVRINGTGTTNATVAAGATLDGTGRIVGSLTNNGTVAPGNSIGTLTVQGNYVQNAGSVLEIEFDGSGGIDLLAVTGSATLNGGVLRFVSLGSAEGSGGTFLTAGGGVTGTFASVETVGAQLPLAVIYQTNSAIMAPSVLTARPSTFNAQFLAAADSGFGFMDSVADAASRPTEGSGLWLQGFGATGSRTASGTTLGYDHGSYGVSGGLTVPVGNHAVVGGAIGWARGDIDLASNGGGGEQGTLLASVYAHFAGQGFSLSGGALYGQIDQSTLRNVSFNGFSASVDGETSSDLYGGYAGLALLLGSTGGWEFGGNVRASFLHQSQHAYVESGTSPLRLAVDRQSVDTVEAQAGVSASKAIGALGLRFGLGARYLAAQGDRLIPVAFAASNAAIVLQGDTRDDVHGYAGVGIDYAVSENVNLNLGYAGQVGTTDRHEARIGLTIGF